MSNTFSLFGCRKRRPKNLLRGRRLSRKYFNGVRNVSFNGSLFSFELEDKFQNSKGEIGVNSVSNLVTEIDSAEKILQFLLDEISKIRNLQETTPNPNPQIKRPPTSEQSTKVDRGSLGKKLNVVKAEHD